MTTDQITSILDVLTSGLRETKRAYYTGTAGVSYDDMRAAAERVLIWRARYEAAAGRKVTTKVTPKAVANLLRSSL